MSWKERYRKAVTFSYDDGVEQDIKLLDILNDYGMKATFNVNTALDNTHGTWKYEDIWVHRLNLPECTSLYRGHEIAVHGRYHRNLTELTEMEREDELGTDITSIVEMFGNRPVGMAYAYGAYHDAVMADLVRLDLRYGRTTNNNHRFDVQQNLLCFQPTCHHNDAQLFELADQFFQMESEKPQIFYVWGHSYEFEGKQNWDRMKRLCEYIGGKSDIFYGTNAEVLL